MDYFGIIIGSALTLAAVVVGNRLSARERGAKSESGLARQLSNMMHFDGHKEVKK